VTRNVIPDIPSRIQAAETLYKNSNLKSEGRWWVIQTLLDLVRRSDNSFEHVRLITETLCWIADNEWEERQQILQRLLESVQSSSFSVEQKVLFAQTLLRLTLGSISSSGMHQYRSDAEYKAVRQGAVHLLSEVAQLVELSLEQLVLAIQTLRWIKSYEWEEQQLTSRLLPMLQQGNLSVEQTVLAVQTLFEFDLASEAPQPILQKLLEMLHRPGLSAEQATLVTETYYKYSPVESGGRQEAEILLKLAQRSDISAEQIVLIVKALYERFFSTRKKQQQAEELLFELALRLKLPIEQALLLAQALHWTGFPQWRHSYWQERQQAYWNLLELIQQPEIPLEQAVWVTQILYLVSTKEDGVKEQTARRLLEMVRKPDLSFERLIGVLQTLYCNSPTKSEEERLAAQMLWQLAQQQSLLTQLRLRAATVALTANKANYSDRAQAVRLVLMLLQEEAAKQHLYKYWRSMPLSTLNQYKQETITGSNGVDSLDVLFLVELAKQAILPAQACDDLYKMLRIMVPPFGSIDPFSEQVQMGNSNPPVSP